MKEFYESIGGGYEDAIQRIPSEAMIKKFVLKFKADPSYDNLEKAKAEKNIENALLAAHTLKGVAATLGFSVLANAASILTEQLRPRAAFPAEEDFAAVEAAYANVMEQIAKLPA